MLLAYIDSGTGSLLIMSLGTIIAGIVLFFSFLKWKILGLFGVKKPEDPSEETETDTEEDLKD